MADSPNIKVSGSLDDAQMLKAFEDQTRALGKIIQALEKTASAGEKVDKSYKKVSESAGKAARENAKLIREGRRITQDMQTPLERYNREMATLNRHLQAGTIRQNTFNRAAGQAKTRLDEAGQSGKQAASAVATFVSRFIGIGAVVGGLVGLARTLKTEYENLKRIKREGLETQVTAGQSEEQLRLNFLPDQSVKTEKDLVSRVRKIATETNIPFQQVAAAASGALSAKGDLSNADALNFVKQSLRVSGNEEFVPAAAQGLLDLSKASGVKDPRALFGFARQAQVKARVTDMGKFFENAPRVALTERLLGGGTAESGLELFSYISSRSGDAQGELARTGGLALIKSLAEYNPDRQATDKKTGKRLRITAAQQKEFQSLKSTNERIRFLQQNPNVETHFEQTAELGRGSTRGAIIGLLRGDKESTAELASIRRDIVGPDDKGQVPAFEKFVADRAQGSFAKPLAANRRLDKLKEEFELAGDTNEAIANKAIENALSKVTFTTGTDTLRKKIVSTAYFASKNVAGMNPLVSAASIIERIEKGQFGGGIDEGEQKYLKGLRQALAEVGGWDKSQNAGFGDSIKSVLQQIADNTKQAAAAPAVVVPPAAKPLGRNN